MNHNQQQHSMLLQQQKNFTSTQAKSSKTKPQIDPKNPNLFTSSFTVILFLDSVSRIRRTGLRTILVFALLEFDWQLPHTR
jgi:hypothetical protein